MVGVPGSGTSGQWSGTDTHNASHCYWKIWECHLCGLQGGKIQLGSLEYIHGPAGLFSWGSVRLISLWEVKARGKQWSLSWHKGEFPGGAVSPGSETIGSLGAITQTGGSTLSIGDGALPSEAGATGSFSAIPSISRSSRLLLWIMEARYSCSSSTAPKSTPGGIPEQTVHLCRALAKATVSSACTTQ